jgi:hypothetical protein
MEIDLDRGIAHAAATVDRGRPAGLRILRRGRLIGIIPAEPGAEPLRGIHLRAEIAGRLAEAALDAGVGTD